VAKQKVASSSPHFTMSSHAGPNNGSITLTEQLSSYMILSLFHRLNVGPPPAIQNHGLSYDIVKDCEMIVAQVYHAFSNQS
jgi:hypothetical protein